MGKFVKKTIGWVLWVLKKNTLTFSIGFAFALLCFVALNAAMKPVSKSEYCGTNCHEMGTAYQSWKASIHGTNEKGLRTECIDCHAPSKDDYFTHLVFKAYAGGKDLYRHHFGGEYDIEKTRKKIVDHIQNKPCLGCHIDLLAKPSSDLAKEAHEESLKSPDEPDSRCIECHEDVGHQR